MSPEIINEQIELMGHQVLRDLLKDVQACNWFAVIADEVTYITNKE